MQHESLGPFFFFRETLTHSRPKASNAAVQSDNTQAGEMHTRVLWRLFLDAPAAAILETDT